MKCRSIRPLPVAFLGLGFVSYRSHLYVSRGKFLRCDRAFTLVELLVVIAIIGTLMGLLLPAVQSAREAGRRNTCASNLRQVAIGCLAHVDQQGFFPSGGWGSTWTGDPDRAFGKSQPGSWAYSILPNIDLNNLYMLASDGQPNSQNMTKADEAARTAVAIYICPTRRGRGPFPTPSLGGTMQNANMPSTANRSDYKMNGGSLNIKAGSVNPIGTRILWNAGPTASDGYAGTGFTDMDGTNGLAAQRSEVRPAHVRDGMSNTYLVGEKYLDPVNYSTGLDPSDNNSCFAGSDIGSIAWTDVAPAQDTPGEQNSFRFGSAHGQIFIMAMADGSTQILNVNISPDIHRNRGIRDDGELIQNP